MVSLRGRLFYVAMKLFFGKLMPPAMSLETYRKASKQPLFEPMPRGIKWTVGSVAGIPGEWITPTLPAAPNGVLLYLHGGGYVVKTPHVHRVVVGRLARAAGVTAFVPDYRLAPENPFPAALEDVTMVYRELRRTMPSHNVVIAGDSGGGGLTAALLLKLRDEGDPLPAAACLISAMLDCTFSGESLAELQQHDPFMRIGDVAMLAKHYYGDHDPRHPYISPVFGDLHGMPPLLVHTSEHEILRAEGVRYSERAKAAGVDVTLKIWKGMIHAFHLFAGFVPEGKVAIEEIGAFFKNQLQQKAS